MIIEERKAKDGKTIDMDKIKDGKIFQDIDKIEMANLVEMGITKMAIIGISTIEIMEIGKEGI
jgi:hypothetical protein